MSRSPAGCLQTFMVGQGVKESSGWGQQHLSNPNSPRLSHVNWRLCSCWARKEKLSSVVQPYNSVLSKILLGPWSQQSEAAGSQEAVARGYPLTGRWQSSLGQSWGGITLSQISHWHLLSPPRPLQDFTYDSHHLWRCWSRKLVKRLLFTVVCLWVEYRRNTGIMKKSCLTGPVLPTLFWPLLRCSGTLSTASPHSLEWLASDMILHHTVPAALLCPALLGPRKSLLLTYSMIHAHSSQRRHRNLWLLCHTKVGSSLVNFGISFQDMFICSDAMLYADILPEDFNILKLYSWNCWGFFYSFKHFIYIVFSLMTKIYWVIWLNQNF